MGLKTPKLHSGLLKNIKSFTLNSILLNKMNYMLLFKLFAYILTPINIVWYYIFSFCIKNIETSTINSWFYLKRQWSCLYFLDTLNNFYNLFLLHITGVSYNLQTWHSQMNTSHTKVTNKKKIKEGGIHRYTTVFLI